MTGVDHPHALVACGVVQRPDVATVEREHDVGAEPGDRRHRLLACVPSKSLPCHKTVMRAYSTESMQVADAAPAPEREHRMHWWKEALIVAVFYGIYSWTRNQFGSNAIAADGVPDQAFTNAERVIQWELNMNLFHEQTVQSWFLPYEWFIQFWNTYYGTAHFIVTLAVFVLLYVKRRPTCSRSGATRSPR